MVNDDMLALLGNFSFQDLLKQQQMQSQSINQQPVNNSPIDLNSGADLSFAPAPAKAPVAAAGGGKEDDTFGDIIDIAKFFFF